MRIIHHESGQDVLYKIWHRLSENMIIYIYCDGGSIVLQDKIYPMKKGTLCFLSSNKYHYTMPDNPQGYDRSKIFASNDNVRGILSLTNSDSHFHKLFAENSVIYALIPPEEQSQVEMIFNEADKNRDNEPRLLCNYFNLMLYVQKYANEHISAPDSFITKAIVYINENLSNPITLENICNKVHLSKYYFCHSFKDIMGITVMEYVLKTRLAAAKALLTSERYSIGEISDMCGFSSVAYFCQAFKKAFAITPNMYRKSLWNVN